MSDGSKRILLRSCRRLFIGITAIYVLVVFTLGGKQEARSIFVSVALCWVGLLCFRMNWRRRVGALPAPSGRFLGIAEVVAFNLLLSLTLAEGALRVAAAWTGHSLVLGQSLDGYRLVPGQDYGHGLRGNRLGYPGQDFDEAKNPSNIRIAALGDSFAVGPAVAFEDNYLTRLQSGSLPIEVLNFGVSGAGPREYRSILNRDVWRFHPDFVLVSIFVGNDVTETLATPRHLHPDGHALWVLAKRGCRILAENRRRGTDAAGVDRLTAGRLSEQTFGDIEARRLAVCSRSQVQALDKKWQRTFDDLQGIVKDCRSEHVPVAFVLIPDEFQVNAEVLASAMSLGGYDAADIDLEMPQRKLSAFLEELKTPCLDLLPAFSGAPETYASRNTHWNARGNHLAAEQITAWLQGLKELKLSPLASAQPQPAP